MAKKILAEARDLTDVLDIRDVAVAAHAYAKAKNADEAVEMAMELKLRSERRAGEFLQEMKKNGTIKRGGDQKSNLQRVSLKNYDISHQESSRWQLLASLSGEWFEEYLLTALKRSQAAMLSEARRILRQYIIRPKMNPVNAYIKHIDARTFLSELSKEVDLLLTDPLYCTDFETLDKFGSYLDSWLPLAISKLKETGQAYIFTGAYPWEVQAYLHRLYQVKDEFNEPQILIWTYRNTLGPNPKNNYIRNMQTIFYIRGHEAPPLNTDILMEKLSVQDFNHPARSQDRYHIYQKPMDLAKRLILNSTQEEDLIVDPFAGTGTFLLAAAELGRRNLGCDDSEDMIKLALERGCILLKIKENS